MRTTSLFVIILSVITLVLSGCGSTYNTTNQQLKSGHKSGQFAFHETYWLNPDIKVTGSYQSVQTDSNQVQVDYQMTAINDKLDCGPCRKTIYVDVQYCETSADVEKRIETRIREIEGIR
jgi:uncharacterized protein YceK